MQDCKPVNTPMDQTKLEPYEVENTKTSPNPQEGEYREIVGSLMYLMICSYPDIAVAVSMLSRFASNPSPQHLQAAKRVLRYLRGTSTYSLCIGGNNVTLHGYSDADWGNNIIDRRSITGYLFCIGNAGPVTWASKRQPTVALSSTEAEYMALSFATQETIWLRSLLRKLQIPEYLNESARPTTIYEDNQSCISLAMNPVHHARTKHIDIRHHFIRDHVDKEIHLEYLPTAEMVADSLTKPLPAPAFKYHRENMCIKHYDNTITPMTKASMTELLNE
ncbi:hypothetical protein PhCBS80983_g06488 [Powellomyces hirtus]|uniref:Uncharacterized protein n=1 Tax=Powellomyces hirtus TaxID=109895 RepID=A0A507DL48_9FUNG|nr:hypothetical protein PhCBS80983_g06488 [Powellomyces hirtus]